MSGKVLHTCSWAYEGFHLMNLLVHRMYPKLNMHAVHLHLAA